MMRLWFMLILCQLAWLLSSQPALADDRITLDEIHDAGDEIEDPLDELIANAKRGDNIAAFKYAERLQRGLPGQPPNYPLAAHWFKIAAQQGNADAAIVLAEMYERGNVPLPSPNAIEEMYEFGYRLLKADAEKGRPSAATRLGLMFFYGQGVKADANQAIKWLQRGVELGSAQAKLALGRLTIWNSTPGYNATQAMEMLQDAADAGQGSAWLYIGLAYSGAYGGRINHPRAVDAFRHAHESGTSAEGTRQYGLSFLTGLGVKKEPNRGYDLIKEAARRGNSEAMYNLGLLYRQGIGIAKNKKEEIKWFKRASAYKIPDADYYLGIAYRDGDGLPKNKELALKYLKRAQVKKHVVAIRDYNALAGIDVAHPVKPEEAPEATKTKVSEPEDDAQEME